MAVRPLTCPFSSLIGLRMPSWILFAFLACLLILPVLAVFAEDRPPPNEITHESEDRDGEAEARAVA